MDKRYLIVMTAPGYRIGPGKIAMESALVEHLRSMRGHLGPSFRSIDVAMSEMSAAQYAQWSSSMVVLDEDVERITFTPLFRWKGSKARFMAESPRAFARLARLVRHADIVHSHLSYDLWRPVELMATSLALALGKAVMSITDMDNRRDAQMNYELGRWGWKTYAMSKLVYDPLRDLQQRALVRACDLVLFKEPQQVEHYGRGASNVRLILDPNFEPEHVVTDDELAPKLKELADPKVPLRVLYFGRLVAYKGVDRMIEGVALARQEGANLRFAIMGSGPDEQQLRALVTARSLDDVVEWLTPRPYGPEFFAVVRAQHLLLACPLSADTPRSTWDAFASGTPLLAFDTSFYAGIGNYTGAVDVVKWPEATHLAARLVEIAKDKAQLVPMAKSAVIAARANTGDEWMKRRVGWVEELLAARGVGGKPGTLSPFTRAPTPPLGGA